MAPGATKRGQPRHDVGGTERRVGIATRVASRTNPFSVPRSFSPHRAPRITCQGASAYSSRRKWPSSPARVSVVAGRAITTIINVEGIDVRTKQAAAIVATSANESEPAFSPDGRLPAYQSDESGKTEVYIQAYPSGRRRPSSASPTSSRSMSLLTASASFSDWILRTRRTSVSS